MQKHFAINAITRIQFVEGQINSLKNRFESPRRLISGIMISHEFCNSSRLHLWINVDTL